MRNLQLIAALACMASAGIAAQIAAPLEAGYRQMYDLEFEQAHSTFQDWERTHPQDPMGPVSDAAAYLFTEFDRLHILQAEFFTHDANFKRPASLDPDPALRQAFERRLNDSKQLADRALARNPDDQNAAFATILRLGLHADYLALIDKSYLASLSEMKRGRLLAEQLLKKDPECYDAYLAVGVENYILSLKPAPVRWVLRLGGAQTDREEGLRKLRLTAERGNYLLPYARLLLAVDALRNNNRSRARELLADLSAQFPHNRLYREELARLR